MGNTNVGYCIKTAGYFAMFRKTTSYKRYEHNNPERNWTSAPQCYDLNFVVQNHDKINSTKSFYFWYLKTSNKNVADKSNGNIHVRAILLH